MLLQLVGFRCLRAECSYLFYSAFHIGSSQFRQVEGEFRHALNLSRGVVAQIFKAAEVNRIFLLFNAGTH